MLEYAKFNAEKKLWEGFNFPYPYSMETFMGDEILRRLKETPNRVIQICHENSRSVTCEELRISSVRIAQNLLNLGVQPDDVVGVISKTSNEITFVLNACVFIGAVINPLDISFSKEEIKHLFRQTLPKAVICDVEIFEKTQMALKELGIEAKMIVTSDVYVEGALKLSDLLKPTGTEDEFQPPKFNKNADEKILGVLCTSGTTGLPKCSIMTHIQMMAWAMVEYPSPPPTFSLIFSPIYWGSGFFPHLLHAFNSNDVRIISKNPFSVQSLVEIVEKYKLTNLTVPPMHLNAILNSDFFNSCKHETLKTIACMGSIVSDSLREKFSEIFPDKNMTISYGSTEIPISITLPGEFKEKLSVGSILFPKILAKIVDDQGNKLGIGEEGEICGKFFSTMRVSFSL